MYMKKVTVLALSSLMTLSLPLVAQESSSGTEVAESEAAANPETTADTSSSPQTDSYTAMQERWRERDERYEELKTRAKEVGVMLPDDPPWKSPEAGMMPHKGERWQRHQEMMSMTPEERRAAREAHFQEMQSRAGQRGTEMSAPPPWVARQSAMQEAWAQHQAVIDGMSDEERAACHAMHRRHMGMMMRQRSQRQPTWGPGVRPGAMEPGWGPGMMGRDYGYGSNPYGPPNFWDPNQ
jgi:hypothetical protein